MEVNEAHRGTKESSVLKAGIKLVEAGLIARTWGNVSCRLDAESFLITPSGRSYQSLTAADLVRVKIEDLSYEGSVKPSSEKGVHAEVYKLYPEINFVIHTHQDNASVLGAAGLKSIKIEEIKRPGKEGPVYSTLGIEVVCADYALPGTKALRKKVRDALCQSTGKAVMMRHHGALCFGRDDREAFTAALELEQACADLISQRYLELSGEQEYRPAALCAFALARAGRPGVKIPDQPYIIYGHSRRNRQGFIWYDQEKEVEFKEGYRGDSALASALPEEIKLYDAIYKRNKEINQIRFKVSPELLALSALGLTMKPLLDDFAQIVGLQVKTVEAYKVEEIVRALSRSSAVLVRNVGAVCCGKTKEDAEAVEMIIEKSAKAYIGALLFDGGKPINPLESMLMRYVYLRKYARQIDENT